MNTNAYELTLNEMAIINGGDTLDHAAGAAVGATVGAIAVGATVGAIAVGTAGAVLAGAPGAIFGVCAGAIGGGVAGGTAGIKKIKGWFQRLIP